MNRETINRAIGGRVGRKVAKLRDRVLATRRPSFDEDVRRAEELAAAGRPQEAVDHLAAANERHRDPRANVLLRDLRHTAGVASRSQAGRPEWPPSFDDPFPSLAGIPEISRDQLSTEMIGGAVANHGCLLVRGMFDQAQVDATVDSIKRAQSRMGDDHPGDEWYHRFAVVDDADHPFRARVERTGGTWLGDAPNTLSHVVRTLKSIGAVDALTEYFGERPVVSLQKSTLRCIAPEERLTAWHQDGSFLDDTVRTMNIWVALTTCGADHKASGLEIVPRRMHEILPLQPELAKAAVPFELVDELAVETPIVRPEFLAGDALIFDERLLHRTYLGPGLELDRYALECWFFAPSHATSRYTPFLV